MRTLSAIVYLTALLLAGMRARAEEPRSSNEEVRAAQKLLQTAPIGSKESGQAAVALARSGDLDAVDAIVAVVRRCPSVKEQIVYVEALGETHSPRAGDTLSNLFSEKLDPQVRGDIAIALGKIGSPSASYQLITAYYNLLGREVMREAELNTGKKPSAATAVDPQFKLTLIKALGLVGSREAQTALMRQLRVRPVDANTLAAAHAMLELLPRAHVGVVDEPALYWALRSAREEFVKQKEMEPAEELSRLMRKIEDRSPVKFIRAEPVEKSGH